MKFMGRPLVRTMQKVWDECEQFIETHEVKVVEDIDRIPPEATRDLFIKVWRLVVE